MCLFLTYQGSNLRDYDKWTEILDEKVVIKMPITPYRSFHKADIVNNSRLVRGIEGAITECVSVCVAQGIGFSGKMGFSDKKWYGVLCVASMHSRIS